MSDAPPTILSGKQAFLELETARLSQPLAPSRAWRRTNDSRRHLAAEQDKAKQDDGSVAPPPPRPRRIPDKIVDEAVLRANQILQQHARRVYAPQAVRHVAEQIDQLYEQAAERTLDRRQSRKAPAIDPAADYTQKDALDALPPSWEDEDPAVAAALPEEAERYTELLAKAQVLADQRAAVQARVLRLRRMQALLEPLQVSEDNEDGDPRQDNLVTRDGPVERELERMRLLLARVGDRVATLPTREQPQGSSHMVTDVETVAQKRVQSLLEQY